MSDTVNMNIPLPVPLTDTDIEGTEKVVDALEIIDAHAHTGSDSLAVNMSNIEIDTDVDMNEQIVKNVEKLLFNLGTAGTSVRGIIFKSVGEPAIDEMFIIDGEGTETQITSNGSINVSSVGGITGMSGSAAVQFTAGLIETFSFLNTAGTAAGINAIEMQIQKPGAETFTITYSNSESLSSYTIKLPATLPTEDQILRIDSLGELKGTTVQGTSNEVEVTHNDNDITIGLPSAITVEDLTASSSIATSSISVDTISESTSANGVSIDGLSIKDGKVQTLDMDKANEGTLAIARGGTGTTSTTGSGNVVFSSSPTLSNVTFSGSVSGTIASGYYTPSLTRVAGRTITSSTIYTHFYQRIGNVVTVSGRVTVAGDFSAGYNSFYITLPYTPRSGANYSPRGGISLQLGVAPDFPTSSQPGAWFEYSSSYENYAYIFLQNADAFNGGSVQYTFSYYI